MSIESQKRRIPSSIEGRGRGSRRVRLPRCRRVWSSQGAHRQTPTALADKFASTVTDDGWSLDLAATKLSSNPVPNLATTAFTREGFVSGEGDRHDRWSGRFGSEDPDMSSRDCRSAARSMSPPDLAWGLAFRSARLSV